VLVNTPPGPTPLCNRLLRGESDLLQKRINSPTAAITIEEKIRAKQ